MGLDGGRPSVRDVMGKAPDTRQRTLVTPTLAAMFWLDG